MQYFTAQRTPRKRLWVYLVTDGRRRGRKRDAIEAGRRSGDHRKDSRGPLRLARRRDGTDPEAKGARTVPQLSTHEGTATNAREIEPTNDEPVGARVGAIPPVFMTALLPCRARHTLPGRTLRRACGRGAAWVAGLEFTTVTFNFGTFGA